MALMQEEEVDSVYANHIDQGSSSGQYRRLYFKKFKMESLRSVMTNLKESRLSMETASRVYLKTCCMHSQNVFSVIHLFREYYILSEK